MEGLLILEASFSRARLRAALSLLRTRVLSDAAATFASLASARSTAVLMGLLSLRSASTCSDRYLCARRRVYVDHCRRLPSWHMVDAVRPDTGLIPRRYTVKCKTCVYIRSDCPLGGVLLFCPSER